MNMQVALTRAILKLPAPLLVAMSGGRTVEVGGRPLDPHFQFIGHAAARQPPPAAVTPESVRQGTDMLTTLFGGKPDRGVSWSPVTLDLPGRAIGGRVYRPERQNPAAPLMVYYHFGGGVVGTMETCHAFCTILAAIVGCPVLSVDYRLAPEHVWPAGLDDAIDAYLWGRDNAGRFGAPTGVAAAGGDSMGGNFTAILCQEMKRRGEPQPFLQLLIYPATDITAAGGSMDTYGASFPLTADTMAWFMSQYLPEGADPAHERLSPHLTRDLSGLAPAIVVTAGHDPLSDQGDAYAERLEAAGVNTLHRREDTLVHGFIAFTGGAPAADAACRHLARDVAKAYRAMGA
jgi:acetyl esterase/lipase